MVPVFVLAASMALQLRQIRVSDLGSLRAALSKAVAGTRILIAPGDYQGGLFAVNLRGKVGTPIVLEAADSEHPPVFKGAIQFVSPAHLQVRNLAIDQVEGNAIAADDGGDRAHPASDVELVHLRITHSVGAGSSGIKLAGVDGFQIRDCDIDHFDGCGIDMVGCHQGQIDRCRFTTGGVVGIQAKGASAFVSVTRCTFRSYGSCGVNIGGSTGAPFFRPVLDTIAEGKRYESREVAVQGCTFIGGDVAAAFIGADGASFRFNTILDPNKWAFRILQESSGPAFVACRNGRIQDNLVQFDSTHWFEGGVNIGPGTAPASFIFQRNWWYCSNAPEKSRPSLPSEDRDAIVGHDPRLRADATLEPGSPAAKYGSSGFREGNVSDPGK